MKNCAAMAAATAFPTGLIATITMLGVCCSKLDFEKIILISNNYHDANAHNSHEI